MNSVRGVTTTICQLPEHGETHVALPPDTPLPPQIWHIKRFLERYNADKHFQRVCMQNPSEAAKRYNLTVDPEALRCMWDPAVKRQHQAYKATYGVDAPVPEMVAAYRAHIQRRRTFCEQIRAKGAPQDPRMKAWRDRQIARFSLHLSPFGNHSNTHAPVCFELSKGCSGRCWFCSLAAEPLRAIFAYSPENARLWRGVLNVINDLLGPAAGWGFCYWATEPFDNPDYEQLMVDFHAILGQFPQTTTARPVADPDRMRKFLTLCKEHNAPLATRFSIRSLAVLDQVHKEFSPEELAQVELIPILDDGAMIKTKTGRFYELCRRQPDVWAKEKAKARATTETYTDEERALFEDVLENRTTACVSGFLINMVDRSVRFISPCVPDDDHPFGYITYGSGTFANAADFRELLDQLLEDHAAATLRNTERPIFRKTLALTLRPDGFQLSTNMKAVTFTDHRNRVFLHYLARLVRNGAHTVAEIAVLCRFQHRMPEQQTINWLNEFSKQGVLDEERR